MDKDNMPGLGVSTQERQQAPMAVTSRKTKPKPSKLEADPNLAWDVKMRAKNKGKLMEGKYQEIMEG